MDAKRAVVAGSMSDEVDKEDAYAVTESAVEPQSLAQRVSEVVWEILKPVLPDDSPRKRADQAPKLEIAEEELQKSHQDRELLFIIVGCHTISIYNVSFQLLRALRRDIVDKVMEILEDGQYPAPDPNTTKLLRKAFDSPYVGDAVERFHRHLARCCERYYRCAKFYTAPLVAITQSSGFGKSRILHQLAKKLSRPSMEQPGSDTFDMRLLYVCERNVQHSPGFPVATPALSEFFFEGGDLEGKLMVALEYALANWETVKTDWLRLFGAGPTDEDSDGASASGVSHEKSVGADSDQDPTAKKQRCSSVEITTTSDCGRDLALALETMKREGGGRDLTSKKLRGSAKPATQDQRVKVLVLAIDEARSLFEKKWASNHYLRLLIRALTTVHIDLFKAKRKAMIFAVLVDSNPLVECYREEDATTLRKRSWFIKREKAFPPFVLTHTMDVHQHYSPGDPPFDYKASVLEGDPDKVWRSLVSMGRPLWYSYMTCATGDLRRGVLFLAGSRLLCGWSPAEKDSYSTKTMHGVASLLCRLGLRPQACSVFASQVVADFMAVLHYVDYRRAAQRDSYLTDSVLAQVCGYVTEPVLAFAATHLWYELTPLALQEFILPQFQDLVMQGVLDVGDISEVVARIVLLLAMDATIMSEENDSFALLGGEHSFTGQFCSVERFLGQLDGSSKPRAMDNTKPKLFNITTKHMTNDERKAVETGMEVTDDASPEQRVSFESWMNDWEEWSVGFSHFVELTAVPTEAMLWFLLGRRAAGVFPRDYEGADLAIPIFRKSTGEVSLIVVQVTNKDSESQLAELQKLTPVRVFEVKEAKNAPPKLPSRRMLRVVISLREGDDNLPAQSYLVDTVGTTSVDKESYILCLRGMCQPSVRGAEASLAFWPCLVSTKVSDQLAHLVESICWDPLEMVRADLVRRSNEAAAVALKGDVPDEEVEEGVRFTLHLVPYDDAVREEEEGEEKEEKKEKATVDG